MNNYRIEKTCNKANGVLGYKLWEDVDNEWRYLGMYTKSTLKYLGYTLKGVK